MMREQIQERPRNVSDPGAYRFGNLVPPTPVANPSPVARYSDPPPTTDAYAPYRDVLSPYLDETAVQRQLDLLHAGRGPLVGLAVDQEGRVLWPYPYYEALVRYAEESPGLGVKALEEALGDARTVSVADLDNAATLIRGAHLGLSLAGHECNGLIADQIRQMIRSIEARRVEIDDLNPRYKDKPIRPSASWVSKEIGVDNKRVERVYCDSRDKYGLLKYADLPSLGSDLKVQKGTGATRGRPPKSATTPRADASAPSRKGMTSECNVSDINPFNLKPLIPTAGRSNRAIEQYRREVLLETNKTVPPARSRPPEDFTGATDQMPPTSGSVPLGEGGIGIDHLYTAACLFRDRNMSTWPSADKVYAETVLGAFSLWVESWRAGRA